MLAIEVAKRLSGWTGEEHYRRIGFDFNSSIISALIIRGLDNNETCSNGSRKCWKKSLIEVR